MQENIYPLLAGDYWVKCALVTGSQWNENGEWTGPGTIQEWSSSESVTITA
jgi:hypothetical protein